MDIKELKFKSIDIYSMILSGILYIGLGILFLSQKSLLILAVGKLLDLLVIFFIIASIFQIMAWSPMKGKEISSISRSLGFMINITMAGIVYFKAKLFISIFPIFFGIYALVSGLIRFLVYIQYRRNKVKRRFFVVVGGAVLVILGIMIIMHPLDAIVPILNMIGIFFVLYGISYLIDALLDGLPREVKNSFKSRVRISLPSFLLATIPHNILMKINETFETDSIEEKELIIFKEDRDIDLEVFIHVTEKGINALGHVDISFEDKVITYGTYDRSSYKLRGVISEGVLIEIRNKESYIEFSKNTMNKTLFAFGIKLTENEKERVREKIDRIYENLKEWKPLSQIDEEAGLKTKEVRKDYASIVYENLDAKFYKFRSGPFKTYFGFNTNCVLLADKIVGQAGIDIIKIKGFISPGAYFEYLNKQFLRENSIVISRTIYHN